MPRKFSSSTKKFSSRKSSAKKSRSSFSPGYPSFASESRALETWLRTEIVPSIEHVYALIQTAHRNYKQRNTRVAEYNRAEITHTMMTIHEKLGAWVAADSAQELLAA